MDLTDKKKRKERTSQEQLSFYVEFCSANPVMISGRVNPTSPQELRNKWDELASSLNALRGPTKTTAQWKDSLSHWKNMVRSRARQQVAEQKATGGGPQSSSTMLSDLDLRAVSVFGQAAVSGRCGVPTMGFAETPENELPPSTFESPTMELPGPAQNEPETTFQYEFDLPLYDSPAPRSAPVMPQPEMPLSLTFSSEDDATTSSTQRKRRRVDPDVESLELLRHSLEERKRMDKEMLKAQQDTAAAIRDMAAAVLALSQTIAKNAQTEK